MQQQNWLTLPSPCLFICSPTTQTWLPFLYHSHYLTTPAKGSRFHHMLPHITALSHSALSLTPLAFQTDTLLTSNTQSQVSPRIVGLLRTPLCL